MVGESRLKRLSRLLFVMLILSLTLVGCGQSAQNTNAPQDSNSQASAPEYTIADPTGDWGYPSPYAHSLRGPGYIRMSFIFDTLVWKDENGIVPALASKWQYLGKENAYLFELNNQAKWHDGKQFTARDVAFTFDYTKKHPYNWVDTTKIAKVEIINDYQVKIYLQGKYAPFLNNIAGTLPMLPEHIWKGVEKPEEFRGPQALVGTGPYKLVDYNKTQGTYLYEANKNYYLGRPKAEKIKFVKISNEMAPAALERGEISFAQIPPELKEELAGKGLKVLKAKYDWVLKLMINHQKEPFRQPEFRQALAYAINREELVAVTKRGYALAGSAGLLSPDSEWYNPGVEKYAYSPEKARRLLAGLGYELKDQRFVKNGQALELELLVSPDYERDAQFIQQQLGKVGIKVNLKSLEQKALDVMVQDWRFDLALSGHGGIGGDAESLNKAIAGNTFTSARYSADQQLNALMKDQVSAAASGERKACVEKIQELYARDLPCLTLYYPDWYYGHDGRVSMFSTKKGIGFGIPLPVNKLAFVRQ